MCTTHNVTRSTMQVINKELKRGGNITDQIMTGKAHWKDLFTKHTFFTAGYKYYLSVITASTTNDAHLLWSGFVESKVRILVGKLEEHDSVALAHPFNKGFTRVHRCRNEGEVEKAKGGSLEYQAKDIATATTGHGLAVAPSATADLVNGEQKTETDAKVTMVYTTTHYIGLELREGKSLLFPQSVLLITLNCCTLTRKIHI